MHKKLKDNREYEQVNGQWRRVKSNPPVQKRCRVFYKGWPCGYDEEKRILEVVPAVIAGELIGATIFSSKSKAQAAIWRSVQANGIPANEN